MIPTLIKQPLAPLAASSDVIVDRPSSLTMAAVAPSRPKVRFGSSSRGAVALVFTFLLFLLGAAPSAMAQQFTLSYGAGTGGQIQTSYPQGPYDEGTFMTFLAVPSPGYVFNRWNVSGSSVTTPTNAQIGFQITANTTLAASFTPIPPPALPTTGSQGFSDIGAVSANNADITAATQITIGNLISTGSQSGYFSGLSTQIFGPVSFTVTNPGSFSFGNATMGSFVATSIIQTQNQPGVRSFYISGQFTAGTFSPTLTPTPAPASLSISFTQSPAGSGSISNSATLSIPPTPVPTAVPTPSPTPPPTLNPSVTNGSQGFVDIGAASANNADITAATQITIGNLISTASQSGYFSGLSIQIFGPVSFTVTNPGSFSFGNATMGSFVATSIVETQNTSGARSFYVLGQFTAGTFSPTLTPTPAPASLLISFIQSPAGNGVISNSATLSIPPAPPPTAPTAPTAPTVTGISPNSGSTSGGTSVTITGTGFTGATGVTIGGTAATNVNVVNATTLTCTTPTGVAGAASVVVTTPSGSNTANTLFTYEGFADLAVTLTSTPNPVLASENLTFTLSLTNHGPSTALNPTVSLPLPAALTFVSALVPDGWQISNPAVGAGGTVTISHSSLSSGATATCTVVAKVISSATTGTVITAAASAAATSIDPVDSNDSDTIQVGVGTVNPTALQLSAIGVINRQNGLFDFTVNVTNTTPIPINGFRLRVDFATYLAAYPSLRLYNATSEQGSSDVFVDFPYPVAVNGVVPVSLSFYTNTRTFPNPFTPSYSVEILPSSAVSGTNGSGVQPRIEFLQNGNVMLEFPTVPGLWYRVRYSHDLTNWFDSPVPIQASNNRMQWIDTGAPLTSGPPSSVPSRYYRVNQIMVAPPP